MTEEQAVKVITSISNVLVENNATIGDVMWLLPRITIEMIDTNVSEKHRSRMKMECAEMFLKSAGLLLNNPELKYETPD